MKGRNLSPQQSFFFRVVAFFSRLQFSYLYKNVKKPHFLALLFVFVSGATALATIALTAYLIDLPLLFPPLGPTAFILFYTPMASSACPRSFVLSHSIAVAVGLAALYLFRVIFPESELHALTVMNWYRIFSVALAMGSISAIMVWLNIAHPPAAATALIAVMGYLDDPYKIMGIIAAVIILAIEGFVFNRLLGGLPYPLWRTDPKVARSYGVLAGIPKGDESFWEQLSCRIEQRR